MSGTAASLQTSKATGLADPAWRADVDGLASILANAGGELIVAGEFDTIAGQTRLGIARLDPANAQLGTSANVAAAGLVWLIQSDGGGGYWVAGRFSRAAGFARKGLLRLTADLRVDPDWAPSIIEGSVSTVAPDPSTGKLYVGGLFRAEGDARNLVRVDVATGAIDLNWHPDPDARVSALGVHGGTLYAGGDFAQIAGQSRQRLARFQPGATLPDPAWLPEPDGEVSALAIGAAGEVYAAGDFTNVGGAPRNGLARLEPGNGNATAGWNPMATWTGAVRRLQLDGNWLYVNGQYYQGNTYIGTFRVGTGTGQIGMTYAGGSASNSMWLTPSRAWLITDAPYGGLMRSSPDTGDVDPDWNTWFDDIVLAIAGEPTDRLIVGGIFGELKLDSARYWPAGLAVLSDDVIFSGGF